MGRADPEGKAEPPNRSSWKADLPVGTEKAGLFSRLTMHRKSLESGEPTVTESATSKTDRGHVWWDDFLGFFTLYSGFMPQKGKRNNCSSTLLSTHLGQTLCWQREEHRHISLNKTSGQQCSVVILHSRLVVIRLALPLHSRNCLIHNCPARVLADQSWFVAAAAEGCGWSEGAPASSLPTATVAFLLQSWGLAPCKCRQVHSGPSRTSYQLMANLSWPWSVTAEELYLRLEVVWGKTRLLLAAESEQANAFH